MCYQIVYFETMEEVEPNITGELYVKTLAPMMGYYKQQEKTNSVINDNGWIRTGIVFLYLFTCSHRQVTLHQNLFAAVIRKCLFHSFEA